MILRHSLRTRRGFTLIEVLLASMLATFVMAAVYMLMNVTMTQTQLTRDAVDVEDLSRGVFNKMNLDLSGTLAPLPPKSGGNSAASGGGSAASTSTSTASTSTGSGDPTATPTAPASATPVSASGNGSAGATATAPSSTGSTGTGTTTTDPSATDNSTAVAADYAFQGGVIGEEKKLIIFAGRVPESFGRYGESGQVRSDQRQIIYWLGKEGSGGLYRRERPWVTADDVRTAADDDETATDSTLLAEEVTDLQFEYSDGTTWATTWDGTTPGPDGVTPLGPPRAIRVTLSMSFPVSRGEPLTKSISQVFALRAAPGTYTPPLLEATTDGGDNAVPADPSTTGGTTGATGGGAGGGTGGGTGGKGGATGGGGGAKPSMGGGGARPSGGGARPSGGGAQPSGGGARPSGGMPAMGGGGARPSGGMPAGGGGRSTPSGGTGGARGGGR